jgi:hypothetical protein
MRIEAGAILTSASLSAAAGHSCMITGLLKVAASFAISSLTRRLEPVRTQTTG